MRRIIFPIGFFLAMLLAACSATVHRPTNDTIDGFVTVGDGVRLYYVEKGTGPGVLVAPAALYLAPLLLDELSTGRRVIFYDPRNRGRSDAADLSRVSLERQIQDLEELRIELGLESMMLLGWSSYGLELAVYAMRYPERVERLVQVSPIAPAASIVGQSTVNSRRKTYRLAVESLDRRAEAGEFDDAPETYCRLRSELSVSADFVNVDLASRVPDDCGFPNEQPKTRSDYFRAFFATFGDFDWRDELSNLDVPRLIIHGREDRIPFEGAKAWAAGHANARLMIVSPSGHFPFIEQHEQVVSAIDTFLVGQWPRDAVAVPSADRDRLHR